jgi:hypothetical protein
MLLAGLGGSGCVSPDSQAKKTTASAGGFGTVTRGRQINTVQGPLGEPVMATQPSAARGTAPGSASGVRQASAFDITMGNVGMVRPASGYGPSGAPNPGCTNCSVPGVGGQMMSGPVGYGPVGGPGFGYGPGPGMGMGGGPGGRPHPQMPDMPQYGILPVPGQGVPGAVAAVGAMTPGMMRPGMVNGRSSINFTGPAGMKVTWQLPDGTFGAESGALTAPKEYNFLQGQVYRLRLGSILPDFPGRYFYPTLEVAPATPKTLTFLSHSSVPVTFTPDDFAQARAGNLVVKVIYLPDPINQDFSTVVAAEEVVTTRLEPGADPVAEAQRRGTILAVIRMGNIDLENKASPSMTAPPPGAPVPPGVPLPVPKVLPKGNAFGLPEALPGGPVHPPGTASIKAPATLPPMSPIDTLPTAPGPKAK